MTWLTYLLIAVTFALIAAPLLMIAIGLPKLKRQLDAQGRDGEGG